MPSVADTQPADSPRARVRLDRDAVLDVALALSETEGLEGVTIRRLAKELAVTPMALYWHFKDKAALFDALGDRVWDEVLGLLDAALAAGGEPWDQLRAVVGALVDSLRRRRAVASLVPPRVIESPSGLQVTERCLGLLEAVGFGPEQAAQVARYVLCSAIMLVATDPDEGIADDAERDDLHRRKLAALTILSPEEFPHVSAAAPYLSACAEPDSYLALGVELVIGGVRSRA